MTPNLPTTLGPIMALGQHHDPITEDTGHTPDSDYVRHFWLPVIGPSAYVMLRRLHEIHSTEATNHRDIIEIDLVDTAAACGLKHSPERTGSTALRTLQRLAQFGCASFDRDATFYVRYALEDLRPHQVRRLSMGTKQRLANHVIGATS